MAISEPNNGANKMSKYMMAIGLALSLLMSGSSLVASLTSTNQIAIDNRARLEKLESKVDANTATRREIDDVKARLARIEDKLDVALEHQAKRNK